LGGYHQSFEAVTLEEVTELAVVSIATPHGGADAVAESLKKAYGVAPPKAGEAILSDDGQTRFLGMASDQIFAVFDHAEADAAEVIAGKLNDAGYCTLQSDNWVGLRISGSRSRDALARICPIDLAPSVFPEGKSARTIMEHMGVIIYPDGPDSFVLLSASSSAGSFLHALETSINNVLLRLWRGPCDKRRLPVRWRCLSDQGIASPCRRLPLQPVSAHPRPLRRLFPVSDRRP